MKNILYLAFLAPCFALAQESRLSQLPPEIEDVVRKYTISERIGETLLSIYRDQKQLDEFEEAQRTRRAFQIALRNKSYDIRDTIEKDPLITMRGADKSKITIISVDSSRYNDHIASLPDNYFKFVCQWANESKPAERKYQEVELVSIVYPDQSSYLQLRKLGNTEKEVAKLDALARDTYLNKIGMNENFDD